MAVLRPLPADAVEDAIPVGFLLQQPAALVEAVLVPVPDAVPHAGLELQVAVLCPLPVPDLLVPREVGGRPLRLVGVVLLDDLDRVGGDGGLVRSTAHPAN